MKIRLLDITDKEKRLESSEDFTFFPSLAEMQAAGECEFISPVAAQLSVVKEFDHIRLSGTVATTVRLHCSRCLAEYQKELFSRFTVFYTPADGGESLEDEVELAEEDLVSATYSGEEIDFAGEVAEQLMLEMPYKPLCDEECKGLCPVCGVDLNSTDCSCEKGFKSLGFSPLQGFKVK